jgi:hypothetical protein
MFRFIFPATALILLASIAASSAKPPAHKTMVQPSPAARAGCLDNSRYLSRTAYLPAATSIPPRCGHLLSTDTLLTIRQWDHT